MEGANRRGWWLVRILFLVAILEAESSPSKPFEVEEALAYCVEKSRSSAEWWGGRPAHPRAITDGTEWEAPSVKGWVWTHGFWPGVLWMAYAASGDESIRAWADRATQQMEPFTKRTARDHDLGFMIMGSVGKAYELDPTPERAEQIIRSAEALYQLIDPDVGTLFSWPFRVARGEYAPYNTIIDSLLNQELFFRASQLSGEEKYHEAAVRHADRILGTHIRPDFSSYHLAIFDDLTGVVLQRGTHQGFAAESTWARGQAWGIYGFAMCYRESRLPRYRHVAEQMAAYFVAQLPPNKIPYWDFHDPAIPDSPWDASAAAIAACGLLILADADPEGASASMHAATAESLLAALWENCRSGTANAAFLGHSTGNRPRESEVDVPIIYADYYFIEGLLRLREWQARHGNSTAAAGAGSEETPEIATTIKKQQ